MKNQLPQRRNIRLSPEAYTGRVLHIIICTRKRTPLFANEDIAYSVKQQILDLSHLKKVKIYAYVIMPDHIHLLVSPGEWAKPGDYVRDIKGKLSAFLRKRFNVRNIWQKGFYDHVMRKDEDLNSTAEYILNNPVRSGRADNWENYPWCGSDVFEGSGEVNSPLRANRARPCEGIGRGKLAPT